MDTFIITMYTLNAVNEKDFREANDCVTRYSNILGEEKCKGVHTVKRNEMLWVWIEKHPIRDLL